MYFYKSSNGNCQIEEFLDAQPGKVAKKILWVLKLLEDIAEVPSTYFKKVTGSDGIWECRVQLGSNIYRILCFYADNNSIILTNGFVKKSQKLPKNEIIKAEMFKNDYLLREGKK